MARRTKDEAEKTRNSILDAAEKVFYKHGVASSSLEDVASAAKVTRGAVYWHFRDKIELCEAMLNRVLLPQEDIIERLSLSNTHKPLEDLSKACRNTLKSMATDAQRLRVFSIMLLRCEYVDEMAAAFDRRRECKDRMYARFLRLFESAQRQGMLASLWTPQIAAVTLQAIMIGLVTSMVEGRSGYDIVKTGTKCLKSFFTSLSQT
jgi:AcrR family transcriptional regulator